MVIAGAAFVAALVVGDSLVAAFIAVMVIVAVSAFIPNRGKPASDADYPSERSRGEPYVVSHAWTVGQKAELSEIARALDEKGLTLHHKAESPNEIILTSGSQLWTRLFGGYFVDSRRLPVEIYLKTLNGDPGTAWIVQLEIRDRLGVAVRDRALLDRLAEAAGTIREVVDRQLSQIGGTEVDAVDSTARK